MKGMITTVPTAKFLEIPEGESGDYRISRFVITEEKAERYNFRNAIRFQSGRDVRPGEYTALHHKGSLLMSDTDAERLDHFDFYRNCFGEVLITGLGLGLITAACASKSRVHGVTVIEKAQEVIDLVAPTLLSQFKDLTIVHADAFTWKPNGTSSRFNAVWHDIWHTFNEVVYEEQKRLHRRYGHWLQKPHMQDSWGRQFMLRQKRHGIWV